MSGNASNQISLTGSDSISTHPGQVSRSGGSRAAEPSVTAELLACEEDFRLIPFFGGIARNPAVVNVQLLRICEFAMVKSTREGGGRKDKKGVCCWY